MKNKLLLGAMALPVAAMGVVAQPSVAEAQITPGFATGTNWSGMYADVLFGGAWGTSAQRDNGSTTTTTIIITSGIPGDGRYNISGPVLGGGFGYNWQNGSTVVGWEADLSWADVSGHSNSCGGIVDNCGTKVEALGTLRARLGMALGGTPTYSGLPTKAAPPASSRGTLVYITGGWAYGDVHAWDSITPASGTKWFTGGWTLGGGVEWALQGNWSAKLEYLYVDLGRKAVFDIAPGIPEFVGVKMNVVRFGLSYKFDSTSWGKAPVVAKY